MFGVMALNREKNNEIINALTPISGLSYDELNKKQREKNHK